MELNSVHSATKHFMEWNIELRFRWNPQTKHMLFFLKKKSWLVPK